MSLRNPEPLAQPRLTVVVPAFGEGPYLGASLDALSDYGQTVHGGMEVIVVDDGSSDDTFEVATAAKDRWPGTSRLRLLEHRRNRGKGAAVRSGMLAAKGELAVFTDADLAFGTESIDRIVAALDAGADVAVGRRARHHGFVRTIAGWSYAALVRAQGLAAVSDPQCGIKGFQTPTAQLLFGLARIDGFAFDVEILYIARRYGLDIREVGVETVSTPRSSVQLRRHAPAMLRDLRSIRDADGQGLYEVPAPRPRHRMNVPPAESPDS